MHLGLVCLYFLMMSLMVCLSLMMMRLVISNLTLRWALHNIGPEKHDRRRYYMLGNCVMYARSVMLLCWPCYRSLEDCCSRRGRKQGDRRSKVESSTMHNDGRWPQCRIAGVSCNNRTEMLYMRIESDKVCYIC